MNEIRIYLDTDHLARAAAEGFMALAAEAVAARGQFSVALAGGSTPRAAYALLATEEFAARQHRRQSVPQLMDHGYEQAKRVSQEKQPLHLP